MTRPQTPCHHFACLTAALAMATFLVGCSAAQKSDLAVAKLSESQRQATGFLPLNEDKPGTPVDVDRYTVRGKYTVVFFYSPYCAPCASLESRLIKLTQMRNDIAVRTININRPGVDGIDWQS